MKINMNEFVKNFEDVIYKKETVVIESLSISVRKYMQIEEKIGLANKIFMMLYNEQFDYVNGKFLIPVIILEAYSDDIEFPENIEDLDATGIYDMLMVSGAMEEIEAKIGSEIKEVKDIISMLVKIKDREADINDSVSVFLSEAIKKTPEEVELIAKQANELMNNENVKRMVSFKDRADV